VLRSTIVTIGNFDGVHKGHQSILKRVIHSAKQHELESVVVIFDPHPSVILRNETPSLLTTPAQRMAWMKTMKIDHGVVLPFTRELADKKAQDFVKTLKEALKMKILCIGATTHIGHNREGTPEKLAIFARDLGFELVVIPPVHVDGVIVSSSRIRKLLMEGEVQLAQKCLGRPYFTMGKVVKGESRGKSLGFPTANLGSLETLVPKRGVYATWASVDSKLYKAATNVGIRPTVTENSKEVVESHLLHFSGDLLGKELKLEWVARLREEMKFSDKVALCEQIQKDCKDVELMLKK